jgi:hypothetical protein
VYQVFDLHFRDRCNCNDRETMKMRRVAAAPIGRDDLGWARQSGPTVQLGSFASLVSADAAIIESMWVGIGGQPYSLLEWPWVALNIAAAVVWFAGAMRAVRSVDRVVVQNRGWTLAWRLFVVCACSVSINGIWIPVGALYALARYRRPSRSTMEHADRAAPPRAVPPLSH